MAIATETTSTGDSTSLDEDSGDLLRMEYEYRTAGAAANRASVDATNATKTLQTLTHRLAKITSKQKSVTEVKVSRDETPPSVLLAELVERSRERSRSMIQRLLASYILRKWGIACGATKQPPRTVPTTAEPRDPGPSDLPPTSSQESDGPQPQDLDVTMAESTVTFGNAMCLNDLDGGL